MIPQYASPTTSFKLFLVFSQYSPYAISHLFFIRQLFVFTLSNNFVQPLVFEFTNRYVKQEQNEPTRAALASGGKAFSKLFALVQCRRMRRGVWVGLLLQMAISVAAMAFAAFVTATTGTILHPLTLLLAIGASGLVTRLIVRCTRA